MFISNEELEENRRRLYAQYWSGFTTDDEFKAALIRPLFQCMECQQFKMGDMQKFAGPVTVDLVAPNSGKKTTDRALVQET